MADNRVVRKTLAETRTSRRRLGFAEIVEAGLPAAFLDFGEVLVFIDGKLFDAQQPEAAQELPFDASSELTGIEYGWRHAEACGCRFCGEPGEAA
jgi:hypothetical protein